MDLCVCINLFADGASGEDTVDIHGNAGLKTVFFAQADFHTPGSDSLSCQLLREQWHRGS